MSQTLSVFGVTHGGGGNIYTLRRALLTYNGHQGGIKIREGLSSTTIKMIIIRMVYNKTNTYRYGYSLTTRIRTSSYILKPRVNP